MRIGSLFAGVGGFDLGFERAGHESVWQVEIDAKCRSGWREVICVTLSPSDVGALRRQANDVADALVEWMKSAVSA